jgi:hypothetical protein
MTDNHSNEIPATVLHALEQRIARRSEPSQTTPDNADNLADTSIYSCLIHGHFSTESGLAGCPHCLRDDELHNFCAKHALDDAADKTFHNFSTENAVCADTNIKNVRSVRVVFGEPRAHRDEREYLGGFTVPLHLEPLPRQSVKDWLRECYEASGFSYV